MADIRKRKNDKGTTSYQVRFTDPTKKSGFGYRSFPTFKLAQQFKAKKDLQEPTAGQSIRASISVPDAIGLWLEICQRTGRDGREPIEAMTYREYSRRAKVMLRYPWRKPAHQVTPPDVARFRNWLLENHSRDLARRTLSSFGSVFAEMSVLGYVSQNPTLGLRIRQNGRHETAQKSVEIPSDREVQALLAAAERLRDKNAFMAKAWARYQPMIQLALFTGVRLSELRGLPWCDVQNGEIRITQRADQMGTIGPVKSHSARRKIEVATRVTDLVFAWREFCPDSKHDLVFPTSTGRPIMRNNFDMDAWTPMFKEAGLVEEKVIRSAPKIRAKYTPHSMRHFYASKLIEKGKDLKFIQSRMGHASAEITLNVYGHLMKDRDEEHRLTAEELAAELF